MNGSKPTSPAYWFLSCGGRFRKGMAGEFLERGALLVVDTMANGEDDASVMMLLLLFGLLCGLGQCMS